MRRTNPAKEGAAESPPRDIEIEKLMTELEEEMNRQHVLESRITNLDDQVSLLQVREDGNARTEILSMLADLFDRQIAAALATAGISGPADDGIKGYALGLGFTEVQGKTSAAICVQPQVEFRPERLVIPASIADDFLIHDIKIGKNSQLVSTGAIPAAAFTNSSEPSRLRMDVAHLGAFVTVSVTNISQSPRNFQGVFFGPSVNESWSTSPKRFNRRWI
jgi:hypothetical protein